MRLPQLLVPVLLAFAAMLAVAPECFSQAQDPVKLDVLPASPSVGLGDSATVQVLLRAAGNEPAQAPKPFEIEIRTISPSGERSTEILQMQPGQSSVELDVLMTETGVSAVEARNPELLEGSALIYTEPTPGPQAWRPDVAVFDWTSKEPQILADAGRHDYPAIIHGGFKESDVLTVSMYYSPQRKLLADGKDQATIYAFVNDRTPSDLKLRLFNTGGSLASDLLTIHKGETLAKTTLTSHEALEVKVRAISAEADFTAAIGEQKEVSVLFGPPITEFALIGSPPEVSLLDSPEVLAELRDASGTPVATDVERVISLHLEQGQGAFDRSDLLVNAGATVGRVRFLPSWAGTVRVAGVTPGLLSRRAELQINVPMLLLALTAAGGFCGGLIAFLVNHDPVWRIGIGVLTGLVLYWAAVFLGLGTVLPKAMVLNPLSAFVVSLVGGWAGVSVLDALLKRFRVADPTSA